MVEEPPPSKFSALLHPTISIIPANSFDVTPSEMLELNLSPSTTIKVILLPDLSVPMAVRGRRYERWSSTLSVSRICPSCRIIGQPPLISVIWSTTLPLMVNVGVISTMSPICSFCRGSIYHDALAEKTMPFAGIAMFPTLVCG